MMRQRVATEAGEELRFRVKGPDADDTVWLVYEGARHSGFINLGKGGDPDAQLALRLNSDGAGLQRAFGRMVHQRAGRLEPVPA